MKSVLNRRQLIRPLVFAAMCLALCLVLPFLTGQIPRVGKMLCLMHIPVLLAGFLCGPWWAAAVGLVAPLLRNALFGMPQLLPTGLGMCAELTVYGLVSGLLYSRLPKKAWGVYASLLCAMLAGRAVLGAVNVLIYGAMDLPYTWDLFFAGAFTDAIPGIVLHLILVPVLVFAMRRGKIIPEA